VRYGDHQPSATRDLINDVWGDNSPDVGPDGSPGPFITFYAVAGHKPRSEILAFHRRLINSGLVQTP
jgi:hypothetical protein